MMQYNVKNVFEKKDPTVAVSFESMVQDEESFKPYCKEVLSGLKKRGCRIVVWTDGKFEQSDSSAEEQLEMLKNRGVPVDAVNHVDCCGDATYDALICEKAGFDGNWRALGVEYGVLETNWRVFVIRRHGSLSVYITKDFDSKIAKYADGKKGEIVWKTKPMDKLSASSLAKMLKEKRGRLNGVVDGRLKVMKVGYEFTVRRSV